MGGLKHCPKCLSTACGYWKMKTERNSAHEVSIIMIIFESQQELTRRPTGNAEQWIDSIKTIKNCIFLLGLPILC